MQLLYLTTALLLTVAMTLCTYTPPPNDGTCYCKYCNEEQQDNATIPAWKAIIVEDIDGDGNSTICARDRDFKDRNFPSVCHMLCFNRCVRLRYMIVKDNNVTRYAVNGYRTNYYKLRDGPC